jgi:hypothetical protein
MLGGSCRHGCVIEWSAYFPLVQIWQSAIKTNSIDHAFNKVNVQNNLELHQYQVEINADDKSARDRELYLLRGPSRTPL